MTIWFWPPAAAPAPAMPGADLPGVMSVANSPPPAVRGCPKGEVGRVVIIGAGAIGA